MFKKLLFVVLALSLGLVLTGCGTQTNQPSASQNTNVVNPVAGNPVSVVTPPASNKLADQPYASFAYLISGPTLSADAKTALTGFQMTKKTLADGTAQITLKALKQEYHDQTYTLQKGQQLYFIEKNLKDDANNEEKFLMDDLAVVVDADGKVVGQPANFNEATAQAPAAAKTAAKVAVTIANFSFAPQSLTINKGDAVVWTNNDPMTHTVTADGGSFNSSIPAGQSFSFTFNDAGAFTYHCSIHPSMTGTIIVK